MNIKINKPMTINLDTLNDLIYKNEKSFFGKGVNDVKVNLETACKNAKEELDSFDTNQEPDLKEDLKKINESNEKLKISIPKRIKELENTKDKDEMEKTLNDILEYKKKDIQDKQRHINLVHGIHERLIGKYNGLKIRVQEMKELEKNITFIEK